MTLLKLFHLMIFSSCQFKNRSTGKLSQLELKFLGLKTFFKVYIYDPSKAFLFYELFFVSIKKKEHWET